MVESDSADGSDMMPDYNPRFITFTCNWCSYAGADLAGVSRVQMPTNFRIIRLMCSGRIEPAYVLKAIKSGFDGVLVTGCHMGDCHYLKGNENAKKKIELTFELLNILGVEKERLRLEWISASEGTRFGEVIKEFTDTLRELGPSQFSGGKT
jgi:F420-non-reducing hydrogenase iron-sulfur subunit